MIVACSCMSCLRKSHTAQIAHTGQRIGIKINMKTEKNIRNPVTKKASHFFFIRKYRGGTRIAIRYIITFPFRVYWFDVCCARVNANSQVLKKTEWANWLLILRLHRSSVGTMPLKHEGLCRARLIFEHKQRNAKYAESGVLLFACLAYFAVEGFTGRRFLEKPPRLLHVPNAYILYALNPGDSQSQRHECRITF